MRLKNNKLFVACFITPCILVLLGIYLYPVLRTFAMSFYSMSDISTSVGMWKWKGLSNYFQILSAADFKIALLNMVKLTVFGGLYLTVFAICFGVFLSGKRDFKGRNFFRTFIYMPNMISAVALGNAFVYYVFNNNEFGMMNKLITIFGSEPILWMSNHKFACMTAAIIFCATSYHMMLYISGIERIPESLYEAAVIDGASNLQQFFRITLPLMKGTIRTSLTFWCIEAVQMFTWNRVFSPIQAEASTISPVVYMYESLFGSFVGADWIDAGVAASVGILTAAIIQVLYLVLNKAFGKNDLEYQGGR